MTTNTLPKLHNPQANLNCDGEHCTHPNSLVRCIPIDDTNNVHLCPSCHDVEKRLDFDNNHQTFPDLPHFTYPVVQ